MFCKGFVCGWIGMAVIIAFLIWGMTPHADNFGTNADVVYYQDC